MKEKIMKIWGKISSGFIIFGSVWFLIIIFVNFSSTFFYEMAGVILWNLITFPLHYDAWKKIHND